jgi:hypothetical protein
MLVAPRSDKHIIFRHLGYYSEILMPGSKKGDRRGGRKPGTPNKLTVRRVEEALE